MVLWSTLEETDEGVFYEKYWEAISLVLSFPSFHQGDHNANMDLGQGLFKTAY